MRHEEVAGDKIDLDGGSLTGGNGSSRYLGEGLPGSTPDAPCASEDFVILLEIVVAARADGSEVVIHAMKMRRSYEELLRRTGGTDA